MQEARWMTALKIMLQLYYFHTFHYAVLLLMTPDIEHSAAYAEEIIAKY